MDEAGTAAGTGAEAASHADPADADSGALRGTLTIKDRAIERIAANAALQVPGVVRQSGGLSLLTGRELPRADITTAAGAVAVNLFVAAEWPYDAAALTRRVHDVVERHLNDYTGTTVHELNVVVVSTAQPPEDEPADPPVPVEYHESDIVAARSGPRTDLSLVAPLVPLAYPAAAPVAALIALGALGVAFVAARELLIVRGAYGGAPWLRNSFEWFGRLHWEPWIAPVAVLLVVVGVVAIVVALKPRKRTHLPLCLSGPVPTVWMRRTDVARMCSARASALPGVLTARTVVDRRRALLRVLAENGTSATDLVDTLRAELEPQLALLADPVPLVVKVRYR